MAKISKLTNGDVLTYPLTIPQAVVDPTTKQSLRTELDGLYSDLIVSDEDVEEVEAVDAINADTATKALQDWNGNDIRTTYATKAYVDGMIQFVTEEEYSALGDVVNTNGVIYFITE